MLKLAADNNLEIKLATSWENQRIGLAKTEREEKEITGRWRIGYWQEGLWKTGHAKKQSKGKAIVQSALVIR